MSLGGFFLLAALIYSLWIGLGWRKIAPGKRVALLRSTLLTLNLPVLLTLYTFRESKLWAHLTFPPAFIAWGVLLLAALVAGWVQMARKRWASGWPLLGLPVAVLPAYFVFST